MSFFNLFTQEQKAWRSQASCLEVGNEIFFPVDQDGRITYNASTKEMYNEATQMCDSCPVASNCFQEATQNDYHGIWAGTSQNFRNYVLNTHFDGDPDLVDLETSQAILDFVRNKDMKFRFQRKYNF